MEITKEIEFDAAHRLPTYNGRCSNIHGHRWKLRVTIDGDVVKDNTNIENSEGMVIDYGQVKKILMDNIDAVFDHSLTLYHQDPYLPYFKKMYEIDEPNFKSTFDVVNYEHNRFNIATFIPTSENLVRYFFNVLYPKFLELGLTLKDVELYETPTSRTHFTDKDFLLKGLL